MKKQSNDLILLDEVRLLTGRSRSSIYADPTFPLPVKVGGADATSRAGRVRWLRHEIENWVQARIADRDAHAAARRQELLAKLEQRRAKRRLTAEARSSI